MKQSKYFLTHSEQYPNSKTKQTHYKKRNLQANSSHEHRHKNPQQNISKLNLKSMKRIIQLDQVGFV